MGSVRQIEQRSSGGSRAAKVTGGIVCPTPDCHGRLGVVKRRNPAGGYITRRLYCSRCGLRFTTAERIKGGYTPHDLQRAKKRLARWHLRYSPQAKRSKVG
jgi:hypothetical protein